jgi:hypothetical protein
MNGAPRVPATQFCCSRQPVQDFARNLHAIADHVAGPPLDPDHAAKAVAEQHFNRHAMVGYDQTLPRCSQTGRINRLPAAARFMSLFFQTSTVVNDPSSHPLLVISPAIDRFSRFPTPCVVVSS